MKREQNNATRNAAVLLQKEAIFMNHRRGGTITQHWKKQHTPAIWRLTAAYLIDTGKNGCFLPVFHQLPDETSVPLEERTSFRPTSVSSN
jgi:hypothetical protein